ncbi:hypothetical protein [Spirillospora sp. NPDC048824]|uniref:hypothetical protein n=1 Tax=Spirillospora sp. NPDC048824 TaxID=3364526 RepID=UPI00372483FE
MERQQPDMGIPREQSRLVSELIEWSGVTQDVISNRSREVATALKAVYSVDLPDRLTTPTISRMKTGCGLKKLRRRNLLLLHLTVRYVKLPKRRDYVIALSAIEEAEVFADTVLRAGRTSGEQRATSFNSNDPRHDRTADLFGEYGISLLECAIGQDDADSFRKLAVLQWLSGNTDDARYWNGNANRTAPGALDTEVAAQVAFNSGRSYLYQGQGAVAETYLALAADAGHADAAFLLGEILETLQRNEEAQRWFLTAQENGHIGVSARLSARNDCVIEGPAYSATSAIQGVVP